jgi:hypothetical protein
MRFFKMERCPSLPLQVKTKGVTQEVSASWKKHQKDEVLSNSKG